MKDTWKLQYSFKFDAAHWLFDLPPGHPCSKLHGHCWKIKIRLAGSELDSSGFLIDFRELKAICKREVESIFDHECINNVVEYSPTCENLAKDIYRRIEGSLVRPHCGLYSVTVEETEGNEVVYKKDRS